MLPLFYSEDVHDGNPSIFLDEDTSRHIVQVLRMRREEKIQLTDGKGGLFTAEITDDHKKKVALKIQDTSHNVQEGRCATIAISILKNPGRFEWFLEKATEIGINEIVPMTCERTERQHFRFERMKNILVSAMLQSRQCWLPLMHEPTSFSKVVESAKQQQKFIAHCINEEKRMLSDLVNDSLSSKIILIGPEGDFTIEEVAFALNHHFVATSLGDTRLRAETAGVVAATLLRLG